MNGKHRISSLKKFMYQHTEYRKRNLCTQITKKKKKKTRTAIVQIDTCTNSSVHNDISSKYLQLDINIIALRLKFLLKKSFKLMNLLPLVDSRNRFSVSPTLPSKRWPHTYHRARFTTCTLNFVSLLASFRLDCCYCFPRSNWNWNHRSWILSLAASEAARQTIQHS